MQSGPRCKNMEETKKKEPAEMSSFSLGFLDSVECGWHRSCFCYLFYFIMFLKRYNVMVPDNGHGSCGQIYERKKSESVARTHHNEN